MNKPKPKTTSGLTKAKVKGKPKAPTTDKDVTTLTVPFGKAETRQLGYSLYLALLDEAAVHYEAHFKYKEQGEFGKAGTALTNMISNLEQALECKREICSHKNELIQFEVKTNTYWLNLMRKYIDSNRELDPFTGYFQ